MASVPPLWHIYTFWLHHDCLILDRSQVLQLVQVLCRLHNSTPVGRMLTEMVQFE